MLKYPDVNIFPGKIIGSVHMSDREKAGLHGPVRTCVEETILPDGKPHLATTEYDPDGRLLTFRFTNSEGTGWGTAKIYDVMAA